MKVCVHNMLENHWPFFGGTALCVELIDTMGARILNSTFISNLEAGVAPRGVLFLLGSTAEIEASTLHYNTSKGASFGGMIS